MTAIHPSVVGARTELAVAVALVANRYHVYLPFFEPHSRIDMVIEDEAGLHRVQCKTGRLDGDTVMFRTCSNTNNSPRAYLGEIDYFGVHAPEIGQVFLVPIADVPTRYAYLRLGPTRNNQSSRIRWASDYLIAPNRDG